MKTIKVPLASFDIWYHVGSKNEKPGKTGFAHLFEHIMFTSTEHWSNFDEVMQTVGGGNNNGTTNNDRTNYFETFTKTGLERVVWLEADRMGYLLNGLDSAKVNVQRGVVQNEKRQGDNQPYSIAEDLTVSSTYPKGHPYSWTVIGSLDDLDAASISDVKDWFKTYYGPNNAIVCVAGDVDADSVFSIVKKYFNDIPASPPIAKHTEWIAKMEGKHYQQAQDRVPQARLQKTWNTPGWGTKDATYLDLLTNVLTNGKSSRLYKRLVYDDTLCSDVSSYIDDREIGGQVDIFADAKPGITLEKIDTVIDEELNRLITKGITDEELERAKTNYFVRFINGMERNGGFGGKSDILAQCQTFGGRPDYYKTIQGWIKAATPDDLVRAAKAWLTDGEYILKITPYPDFTNTDSSIDRTAMPSVAKASLPAFPQVKMFTLNNGLKVYLTERHEVPVVVTRMIVGGGYTADHLSTPGLATLTGQMMKEGTTSKSSTEISDILNNLGSTISIGAGIDDMYVNTRSLSTNFQPTLDLYADILLHPSFPQKDFDRVQKEQLLNIAQEKVRPNSMAMRVLPQLIYGKDHAYSEPFTGSGYAEGVAKLSTADCKSFHDTWFTPSNAELVVVGDIDEQELKQLLEKKLGDWKPKQTPAITVADVSLAAKPTVYLIDKPGAAQSTIMAAEVAPSSNDKIHEAIDLMNNMLGGTFLSRLNMNLREDKHWSYGAGSFTYGTKGPGMFVAYAPVQTDKTKESLEEMMKELKQINSTKKITKEEFENEKQSSILSIPADWEVDGGIASVIADAVAFNRGDDYWARYPAIINNLTLADVQNAAASVVKPQNLTWVIVGDRNKIEKGVRELNIGAVTIVDADGNAIK